MTIWKNSDYAITCMLSVKEIEEMGFSMEDMQSDTDKTEEFLNQLVVNANALFKISTEYGIRDYQAMIFPNNNVMIKILFATKQLEIEDALDTILETVKKLNNTVTKERIDGIKQLEGQDKNQAYNTLVKEVEQIYKDSIALEDGVESAIEQNKLTEITCNFTFQRLDDVIEFCNGIGKIEGIPSSLYKDNDSYHLFMDFKVPEENELLNRVAVLAEEYNGKCTDGAVMKGYLEEHKGCMIEESAIEKLSQI
ncbi:negative regulator of genetic competence sporulation and motility-like [Lachnospiraceae bacterium KM106-2]|nr:negative regulator of genetic competence sporulation and motility-like [Lachnospiraceae bacterium KM106-2]